MVHTVRKKTYPSLVRTLRAVHRRAARPGRHHRLPVDRPGEARLLREDADRPQRRPLLAQVQELLNNAVRRAAKATGSTYVDMSRASQGHDACKKTGVRWVEPVLGTTDPVVVHPNALGERKMAARAIRVLDLR